jgi:glycosyltransferase involved in cell wall biosynthesis
MAMRFLIITHVPHTKINGDYYAYAPYVREMNIWLKHVSDVEIVAPLTNFEKTDIDAAYVHSNIKFSEIPSIAFTSFFKSLLSFLKLPYIFFRIFVSCAKADHIHLRCPGNIGLLGSLVQVLFPKKMKTAKYAGNWDPKSNQPLSYRIQKSILSNIALTKHMQVLVYGNWKNQTKNIKSFFTATYSDDEIPEIQTKKYDSGLNFMFVGSLVEGKQPLFAIQLIEALYNKGFKVKLDLFGDGILKTKLLDYVQANNLTSYITIHGDVDKTILKEAYKSSHFSILPSKSEGWPKAIAEAMFFGLIAISTNISCVSWMLDEGRRGILIENDLPKATEKVESSIKNANLAAMSVASSQWSQKYTLDAFETEIIKLLKTK